VQLQGGQCEKCGVDFAKYAAMLVFQAKDIAQEERNSGGWKPPIWAHVLFFPIPLLIQLGLYAAKRIQSKK
jgi:hypothetical protein